MTNNQFLVHMNGTSAQELEDQFQAVWEAAAVLDAKLRLAMPNARDFYPMEDGQSRLQTARDAHVDLLRSVHMIKTWAVTGTLHARGELTP